MPFVLLERVCLTAFLLYSTLLTEFFKSFVDVNNRERLSHEGSTEGKTGQSPSYPAQTAETADELPVGLSPI